MLRPTIEISTFYPFLWMCMKCTSDGNPHSFVNHQQMKKNSEIHANVECPERNKIFGAKRNMKRHVKNVHRAHNDTWRNSNKSNVDDNFNADQLLPAMYDKPSKISVKYIRGLMSEPSHVSISVLFQNQDPKRFIRSLWGGVVLKKHLKNLPIC